MAQDAPLASVDRLINRIVGVVHAFDSWERVVKIRFLEALSVSVDIVQALVTVDGDEIRCNAHMGAVFGVESVEPEMAIASQSMV